jgi:hypothetical protein
MQAEREQAIMRATIRGYIARWRVGVESQVDRVLEASSELATELDAFFFAVALKNLRQNVKWGRDYCNGVRDSGRGGRLDAALGEFDRAVPGALHVRDLQEHARSYEMQSNDRKLKHVNAPLAIWWERDGEGERCIVNVGGYRLDTAEASHAAARLGDAALEALL